MMRVDCDCPDVVNVDRESKAYKDSIAKIMKSSKCSRAEAERIFDSEFDKIA
jgi:hypothetical protein